MGKLNEIQEEVKQSYGSNSFTTTIKEDAVVFDSVKDKFRFEDPVDVAGITVNGEPIGGSTPVTQRIVSGNQAVEIATVGDTKLYAPGVSYVNALGDNPKKKIGAIAYTTITSQGQQVVGTTDIYETADSAEWYADEQLTPITNYNASDNLHPMFGQPVNQITVLLNPNQYHRYTGTITAVLTNTAVSSLIVCSGSQASEAVILYNISELTAGKLYKYEIETNTANPAGYPMVTAVFTELLYE